MAPKWCCPPLRPVAIPILLLLTLGASVTEASPIYSRSMLKNMNIAMLSPGCMDAVQSFVNPSPLYHDEPFDAVNIRLSNLSSGASSVGGTIDSCPELDMDLCSREDLTLILSHALGAAESYSPNAVNPSDVHVDESATLRKNTLFSETPNGGQRIGVGEENQSSVDSDALWGVNIVGVEGRRDSIQGGNDGGEDDGEGGVSRDNEEDLAALDAIHKALHPKYWSASNWFQPQVNSMCEFLGIECVEVDGEMRVSGASFGRLNVSGTLPAALTSLSYLESLRFVNEEHILPFMPPLYVEIPELDFSLLTRLKRVELSSFRLLNGIPSTLSAAPNLVYLSARNAQILAVPVALDQSPSLANLDFSYNYGMSQVPLTLLQLPTLRNFTMEGSATQELVNTFVNTNVERIDFSYSFDVTRLSSAFLTNEKLERLILHDCQVSVLPDLRSVESLRVLDLSNNPMHIQLSEYSLFSSYICAPKYVYPVNCFGCVCGCARIPFALFCFNVAYSSCLVGAC